MNVHLIERLRDENEMLRERVRQMEEVLRPPSIVIPAAWKLTQTHQRLFRHFLSRETVTKASALQALYSDRSDNDFSDNMINVWIGQLRNRLRPFGITISTVYSVGWRLDNRMNLAGAQ